MKVGAAACAVALVMLAVQAPIHAADDAIEQGRLLFNKQTAPPCALCHTLKHAGATGEIGPSLDELKPDRQRVAKAVRNGIGVMPPFASLSEKDVEALAAYVARVSGAK